MRADRLISIMLLLQKHGKMTTYKLAEELEVSRRTILRDIDALSISGIPIYTDAGHGGGVLLDENYRVSLTGLNEDEVRSLFLASNAQVLEDIGLGKAVENSALKLFAALPSLHKKAVEDVQQRIHLDAAWWWTKQTPSFINDLHFAVYNNRRLNITYERHNGEITTRVVNPYGLIAKASVWYLVAEHDGKFRTYRVLRILEVTLLEETFTRDPAFDLAMHWKEHVETFISNVTQYEFTLRIHPENFNFVRWYTPGFWEVIEEADPQGWIIIRFEVESFELARMLTLGLGGNVKVVEPANLQQAVLKQAEQVLKNT